MTRKITQIPPSERLAEARLFTVQRYRYRIESPSHPEQTAVREIIEHPGAAVIVPFLDADHVVLVRNYRYAVRRELLEFPAGTLEPPEPPDRCAARELQEETGYQAGKIEPLGRLYPSPGILSERMHLYVATDLRKTATSPDPDEHVEPVILEKSRLVEMIAAGRIEDAKTIAAMYLYNLKSLAGGDSLLREHEA